MFLVLNGKKKVHNFLMYNHMQLINVAYQVKYNPLDMAYQTQSVTVVLFVNGISNIILKHYSSGI